MEVTAMVLPFSASGRATAAMLRYSLYFRTTQTGPRCPDTPVMPIFR